MTDASEAKKSMAELHVNVNLTLIFIGFTIFTFIVTINQDILKNDLILATQLAMSIPLFMGAIQSRSKLVGFPNQKRLEKFGSTCFILAYALLINTVGIILATFISQEVAIAFFIVNCIIAVLYSDILLQITDLANLPERITKDLFFIFFILVFGLLHAVHVY